MDRKNKPSALPVSTIASLTPGPSVSLSDSTVTATLPSGDSVTIYLYGATVTSWKLASGEEQLFVSSAAILDGSKPIRGGIPLVFPVFGPPPKEHVTGKLGQHGFARNSVWELLGKSSSEGEGKKEVDETVKLDFGLSSSMLSEDVKAKWPYEFGLVYSVTLGRGRLETGLHVQNKGSQGFEFQALFHSYLAVKDISTTTVSGLKSKSFIDKVAGAKIFTESASEVKLTGETDRVYTSLTPSEPLVVSENGKPRFSITRTTMTDATVWNLWDEKAKGMGDFEPKDGWKKMICVEPGSVSGWTKLEAGDAWAGSQVIIAGKL